MALFCDRIAITAITLTVFYSLPTIAEPQPSTQASDLRFSPRFGIGANSPSSGTNTTTRLETFVPVWQKPGRALTFFEGRLLLDDQGNPGGNILFGFRQYSDDLKRIFGGHLGFDIRNTDNNTFQQLSLGIESLGKDVDLHLNGYWPVGSTRRQTRQRIFEVLQLNGDPRFTGNILLLDLLRRRLITRQFEEALAGVDFEVGKQLLSFKNGGDLRAYLGPYFLHSSIRGNTIGGRLRLQVRPTPNISGGIGIQHDDFFGTHVLGNITFTLSVNQPQSPVSPANNVVARMGDSVIRNNSIIVDTPNTTELLETETQTVAAMNPTTGEPWFFHHVNLGLGNSDGTFESPFPSLEDALGVIRGDGNDIVYVANGINSGIEGFTIPDKVQVRSRGAVQQIDVNPISFPLRPESVLRLGQVQLPFSGDSSFPRITSTVSLGNNTLLSGFDVQVTGAPALVANNITTATVIDNGLASTNSTTNGISINGISGSLNLDNNAINIDNPAMAGVDISNVSASTGSVRIVGTSGSRIQRTGRDGVVLGNNTTIANLNIAPLPNNVDFSGNRGIFGRNVRNVRVQNNQIIVIGRDFSPGIKLENITGSAEIINNQITRNPIFVDPAAPGISHGISLSLSNINLDRVVISENTIKTTGISTDGIVIQSLNDSAIQSVTISGNTIETNGVQSDGIVVQSSNNSTIQSANISGNTVETAGLNSQGISVRPIYNSVITTATISGNTVSTDRIFSYGILVEPFNKSTITTASISENTVSTTGIADGILLRPGYNSAITTTTISGNKISTAGLISDDMVLRPFFTIPSTTASINIRPTTNSVISTAIISGNTVSTTGLAYGINVQPSQNGTITVATISGNTVSTDRFNAAGIRVQPYIDSTINKATISGNTVSTSGKNADGILVRPVGNGAIQSATISNNKILQAGRDSVRIQARQDSLRIGNYDVNPICAAISGNRSDNPNVAMAGGLDFNLISARSPFQVESLTTVSLDNNNAIFSFDGTLVPPGTPSSPFTNVVSCP
ncbi:hypothetical protein AM10699_59820 (plasmid) [Acaryochloris marina MBIC10699]|nr:inverse autotransporter beta domain-containing protein [Acaryochloris marina]BDM83121.1 hypothetical protein AM10699_59820 [Acaryochloris marina MBIC10699]